MKKFQIMALTPSAAIDPSIAIAASRAGSLGVLDLEFNHDFRAASKAIDKLTRFSKGFCGVKMGGKSPEIIDRITAKLPERVNVAVLTSPDSNSLSAVMKLLHERKLEVLVETKCIDEALTAGDAGADGLIAKGNESGGFVGNETTFVLLQRILQKISLPVWAHGGIGLHTAPSCRVAGAAGVVLDSQLLLARESSIPNAAKEILTRMDGSETRCFGNEFGASVRVYHRHALRIIRELAAKEKEIVEESIPTEAKIDEWCALVRMKAGWTDTNRKLLLIGQDAAFAVKLTRRFNTTGGIIKAVRDSIDSHINKARISRPFVKDSPLARSHGTRYPIVQGPMTRVSDRPAFLAKVADAGGMPFLAMGFSGSEELAPIFEKTRQLIGDRPWGVGLIGFVPEKIYKQQIELISRYHPPFALIAGGQPGQARSLEDAGIFTYLHVPSPGMLKMFLKNGLRRFIFEGRECGGHIGPRTSFVLWNDAVDVILDTLKNESLSDLQILFAGGIHDASSSAMVATLASPLTEIGAKVGIIMGTAYLFTKEAVSTGAILKRYQIEAIRCGHTCELDSGPGHSVRCAQTPFAEEFQQEKQRLLSLNFPAEEIRETLEKLNLGRLRIAAKGITHNSKHKENSQSDSSGSLKESQQYREGNYMIGQLAALRDRTVSMEGLHHEVCIEGTRYMIEKTEGSRDSLPPQPDQRPSDVAIIGMACLLPKAPDLQTYWENILNKIDAITKVPQGRWKQQDYYDGDPKTRDKVYSKWGGFLDPVPFNPLKYGIPPKSLSSIEPLQLLTLETVDAVLCDAGYSTRPFDREHTAVIWGAGGGISDLGQLYAFRANLPQFFSTLPSEVMQSLPEWTEDSFPGIFTNVTAGRVANKFDLGGVNCTVDAACASSLAALYQAVTELENRTSDMVIVGGSDTAQSPFAYLCFSKTQALSPTGRCRVFDQSANGTVISEGVAAIVLKRLEDAERDGDRIYAVIKAVGASSDGSDRSLTAPKPEGQMRALERAYTKACFSPATVGLLETHGTGTVVGDQAEIKSLRAVFEKHDAAFKGCAVGSVKSMIGHTKCTAGVAGVIKTALALYHKVLPATMGVDKPNASLSGSPFYVNAETRPWIHQPKNSSRRAGVSGFGFGGTNFHTVLEEYTGNFLTHSQDSVSRQWPAEIFLWATQSRETLLEDISKLQRVLSEGDLPNLVDLAYSVWQQAGNRIGPKLAVIADSVEDLRGKLTHIKGKIDNSTVAESLQIFDPKGIYYTETPFAKDGELAFLFPGQGSQYVDMLKDYVIHFPEVREQYELADYMLKDKYEKPLSAYIYPPPDFDPDEGSHNQEVLTQTHITQPAVGASGMGLFCLMQSFGVVPNMVAGHSYGEFIALCAAGGIDEKILYTLSEKRGRLMMESGEQDLGAMAAVCAKPEEIEERIHSIKDVWNANLNSPVQTIISGSARGVQEALERLKVDNIKAVPVQVSCAFHSPLMQPVQKQFTEYLETIKFQKPQIEVFSNSYAKSYPGEVKKIIPLLGHHLVKPVRWAEQIDSMYQAGARIFVEIGPRSILTNLTKQTLGDHPHLALPLDVKGRPGILQLLNVLGQLAAHGVRFEADRLFHGRSAGQFNITALGTEAQSEAVKSATWIIKDGRILPPKTEGKNNKKSEFQAGELQDQTNMHDSGREKIFPNKNTKSNLFEAPEDAIPAAAVKSRQHSVPITPLADGSIKAAITKIPETISNGVEQKDTSPDIPKSNDVRTTPAAVDAASSGDEVDQVMSRFQNMMNRFLEVQQQIMMAYLNGDSTVPENVSKYPQDFKTVPEQSRHDIFHPAESDDHTYAVSGEEENIDQEAVIPTDGYGASPAEPIVAETPSRSEVQKTIPNKDELTEHVLQVVSDRTGYPPDMLDLDLNMEADLGIDSIKRIEILGTLQQTYLHPDEQDVDHEQMKQVAGVKTLRWIIDWLKEAIDGKRKDPVKQNAELQGSDPSKAPEIAAANEKKMEIPRFRLTSVEVPPLLGRPLEIQKNAVILITDDGRGIAEILADKLRRMRINTARVSRAAKVRQTETGLYTADYQNPGIIRELIDLIRRQQGSIAGIVHLAALGKGLPFEELDFPKWKQRLKQEVKSLYYFARFAGEDIRKSSQSGNAWLIAATTLGGKFFVGSQKHDIFNPWQGGIAGFIKTAAMEWPEVHCKVLDLEVDPDPIGTADLILQELQCDDQTVEIGYQGDRRYAFKLLEAPLNRKIDDGLSIDSNWVVVATGGARGITAEAVIELAKRYQPTIVLAGRSSFQKEREDAETADIKSGEALKKALIKKYRQSGKKASPAKIESDFQRLLKQREIQKNIDLIKQSGARVDYFKVDVCDETSFGEFIDGIYHTFGRIDLFIHGAGIIEDKLIEDKTPDSFDRVFDTKADSAFIISRKLDGESIKGLVFFSSVSGRFGARGQNDYAAASEVLNKLAVYLDLKWPGRVVAINWGPWSGTGMVSPEVQKQFEKSGVELIQHTAGRKIFGKELRYGCKGDSEIVIGGGPWRKAEKSKAAMTADSFPLLTGASNVSESNGNFRIVRTLNLEFDRYLKDHKLDGKPVFPMAMALELMAEVVQQRFPEMDVVSVNNLKVLKGIVLESDSREIYVSAQQAGGSSEESSEIDVDVRITTSDQMSKPCYRGTVRLGKSIPPPISFSPNTFSEIAPFPMEVDEAYRQWLFQGPIFQGITQIEGTNQNGICATLRSSSHINCLQTDEAGEWLIDPVVFDSGLQLIILWLRRYYDKTPLPSGFTSYQRFFTQHPETLKCYLQTETKAYGHINSSDLFFLDSKGQVTAYLKGLETVGSKDLNRLASY